MSLSIQLLTIYFFSHSAFSVPDTNATVELYIHDCAGSSIFNQVEMNTKYWENASAVMIVYDITSQESLQSCSKWLQQIQASKNGGPKFIGVLVGNKCDHRDGAIDTRAEVIQDDAANFGKQLDLQYFANQNSQCYMGRRRGGRHKFEPFSRR